MAVLDFVEKPVEVKAGDTVSAVIGRLLSDRKTAAIVTESGEFKGIVTANGLAFRDIQNPDTAKVRHYVEKINPVLPGTSVKEMAHTMLINNYSSVPAKLENKENIFIISPLDILREIKRDSDIKNRRAKDIMKFPYCITPKDTLSTTKSMLRDLHISHMPVIDSQNRIEGIVDAESLLKSVIGKQRIGFGEEKGERIRPEDILVTSLMRQPTPKLPQTAVVKDVIDSMLKTGSTSVLVEDNGKLTGIITAKDILKLLGNPVEGVYVTVSGVREEDSFIMSVIDSEIGRFVKKISRIYDINYLSMHVDRYKARGSRAKYSIRSTLFTSRGAFFAKSHSWDMTKTVGNVLDILEKEVIKRKEKEKERRL